MLDPILSLLNSVQFTLTHAYIPYFHFILPLLHSVAVNNSNSVRTAVKNISAIWNQWFITSSKYETVFPQCNLLHI